MGLSICHSLITAMGGSIEVTSRIGVGTRFVILLPAADPVGALQMAAGQA